jgi:Flp pilus assembly protein TadB
MYYEMTLRLPAERLDAALAAIKGLAVRIDRESLATEDATSRYVDLQSRLRTLTATEAELRELLAESRERGRKVEDVMAVYRELTEIRGQIEQIQGQLQSIDRLAALSTVHLRLRPDAAAAPIVRGDEWRPWEVIRASARALVKVLQLLVNALIIAVIVILPILLPLWLLLRFLRKRAKRRRDEEVP